MAEKAEKKKRAEDAAALVDIDFEPLPAASDCAAALASGAPLAHSTATSNLAGFIPISVGNTDAAFAQAAHVFREKIFVFAGRERLELSYVYDNAYSEDGSVKPGSGHWSVSIVKLTKARWFTL